MVDFTSILIYAYISGAWVDLTADVVSTTRVKWNRGIPGNKQTDRIASPGYLSFDLDNSEGNSAGLLGYYSPGHANALAGWTSGLRLQLVFVYDGLTKYKMHGRIMPDCITVETEVLGPRVVHIKAGDIIYQMAGHELQLLSLVENVTINEAVPYIIANMPIAPLATDYKVGTIIYPTGFDSIKGRTTALAELSKWVNSELSAAYAIGDETGGETLVVEAQLTRYFSNTNIPVASTSAGFLMTEGDDFLMTEAGDYLMLDETQAAEFSDSNVSVGPKMAWGKNLANRIEVTTYPRRVDAAATTVLFSLQEEFSIEPGETKTGYYCRYRDPSGGASYVNGRDMVTPVSGTDFAAYSATGGGGVNKTAQLAISGDPNLVAGRPNFGTEAVSFNLTNNDAAKIYVPTLQVRGKGIYFYDAIRIVYEDAASQLLHQVHAYTLDMKYQNDPTVGETHANTLLARGKDPDYTVEKVTLFANEDEINMMAFMFLEPGCRLSLANTMTGTLREYFIQGYEAEIIDMKYVYWYPVLLWAGDSTGLWTWDVSMWDVNTTWS